MQETLPTPQKGQVWQIRWVQNVEEGKRAVYAKQLTLQILSPTHGLP